MQELYYFYKDQTAGNRRSSIEFCGQYDRSGEYDRNGMLIAEMNLRNIFENVKVYFISFLRLVVIPVISLAILKISGLVNIHPDGKKLLLIVFLAVITPSASTITQMCQVYGNDSKYASAINVMTTLLSIITMPLMVLLYQTMM